MTYNYNARQAINNATQRRISAAVIVLALALASGALTGWAVGAFDEYLFETHQQKRDAPPGTQRYFWVYSAPFALPMTIAGVVALPLLRRRGIERGPTLLMLLLGAAAGGLVAYAIAAAMVDAWSRTLRFALFGAPVVFFFVPALLMIKRGAVQ